MMYWMTTLLGFFLPILSMLISFYVINGDFNGGSVKNLLATPTTRRQIFIGKCLSIVLLNLFLLVFSMIMPFVEGIIDNSAMLMLFGTKGYYAQSAFSFIITIKVIPTFVSILICMVLTVFLTQIFKKRFWQLSLSLLSFATPHMLFLIIDSIQESHGVFTLSTIKVVPLTFLRCAPLYEIRNYFGNFNTGWLFFIIAVSVYLALSITAAVIGGKKFLKRDF